MCLSPIKIRNNSRSYEANVSPLYNEVPCGKCLECQLSIQSDWFVRLSYEWFYTKEKLNGIVYFITLTFNDSDLPFNFVDENYIDTLSKGLNRLSLIDEKIKYKIYDFKEKFGFSPLEYVPFGHEYFDSTDITKFIKSLRQILDYKGIYPYDAPDTIKYFIAPEYGHELHRVHYHCCFFLPFSIPAVDFREIVRQAWSYSVKRADTPDFILKLIDNKHRLPNGVTVVSTPNGKNWRDWFIKKNGSHVYVKHLRGNCEYSKDNPPYITCVKGLEYVVKYVHKKDEYLSSEKFNLLSAYLQLFPRSITKEYGMTFKRLEDKIKVLRSYFPRVKTSNYIGISILDEMQLMTEEQMTDMLVNNTLAVRSIPREFAVPAYITNRIMYDMDNCDTSLRVLSDIGVKVVRAKLEKKIDDFANEIKDIETKYLDFLTPKEINNFELAYPNTFRKNENFNLRNVAKYVYLFRNVLVPNCTDTTIYSDINEVFDNFEDYLFNKKFNRSYDVEMRPIDCEVTQIRYMQKNLWNMQPCFAGFDEFYKMHRNLRILIEDKKAKKRYDEYKERVCLREFLVAPKYQPQTI